MSLFIFQTVQKFRETTGDALIVHCNIGFVLHFSAAAKKVYSISL